MSLSGVLSSSEIASLVQAAQQQYDAPIKTIQTQETPIKAEISAFGNISSVLGGLQGALGAFNNIPQMAQTSTSVSNSSIIAASSAGNTALLGTYTVAVSGLAMNESLYSQSYSTQSGSIGTGSITLQVGSGSSVSIQITSGNDTLAGIQGAINLAGAGVSATIVNNGSGYQLVVAGTQTGSGNAFSMSGSTTALSGFTYSGTTNNMTESQAASNASATLNGIAISSSTNTFSGALQGVSFTVAATGTSSLSVSHASSTLQQDITQFVSAFNSASQAMQKVTAYSPSTSSGSAATGGSGVAGPLIGNPIISSLESQLLGLVSSASAIGSGGAGQSIGMASVGLQLTSSGTISLNQSQLSSALSSNYAQVAGLFGAMAGSSNPDIQLSSAPSGLVAGVYAVNVTENGLVTSGTVGGAVASGVGSVMGVQNGPLNGAVFAITPGVLAQGTVFFNPGIASSMSALLNGALGSTGSIAQSQQGEQNQITQMNKMISSYSTIGNQAIKSMLAQFSTYENAAAQAGAVSNDLAAIFNSLFGGSSGG
ncbi:flagellar filament capping protein FliD [Acidithiobacillus ferrivorans]|nr:flagellar filament capping protein FliD [Acidithiobacillus ferrivorans]